MILQLTPEQEARLRSFAQAQGKDAETLLTDWVETLTPPIADAPVAAQPRIAGLHKGWITYNSPDWNDPLPESFWNLDNPEDPLYARPSNDRTV